MERLTTDKVKAWKSLAAAVLVQSLIDTIDDRSVEYYNRHIDNRKKGEDKRLFRVALQENTDARQFFESGDFKIWSGLIDISADEIYMAYVRACTGELNMEKDRGRRNGR